MAKPHEHEDIRRALLEDIDRQGKLRMKLKSLMQRFGFRAYSRVRESSKREVGRLLDAWGVAGMNEDASANDYVTLFRSMNETQAARSRTLPPPPDGPWDASFIPLHFATQAGSIDETQSRANARSIFTSIWSFRSVCIVASCDDETFAFIGALLSAVMRRRRLMVLTQDWEPRVPTVSEIVAIARLKRILGGEPADEVRFPESAGVYLVHDEDGTLDEDTVAKVREIFLPHTYRLDGRFGKRDGEQRTIPEPELDALVTWLCAFIGNRSLVSTVRTGARLDIASLLADAARLRDVLNDAVQRRPLSTRFKAGFESTEHMTLKNVMLDYVERMYPGETINVEARAAAFMAPEDDVPGAGSNVCRPDIAIPRKLWIEVETLRGITRMGSSPFFELQRKMQRRLATMRSDSAEVWVLVPSDVAALAPDAMNDLVKNLNSEGKLRIRWGFVDLVDRCPVFANALPHEEPRLALIGAPSGKKALDPLPVVTMADVAGSTEFKKRVTNEVIHPLLNQQLYEKHGLAPANGLLLFGLPGCGKSLMGRVLAGEADLACRMVVPSDLTSMWLGEGVAKIRELFDWALKQPAALIVIDEIDALAPQRSEHNMHTDEKRQVNELLAQLDRIGQVKTRSVMVVATTNYVRGIDAAIRRSGRFDTKIAVYPPDEQARAEIFDHYLGKLQQFSSATDTALLARSTPLFTPSDIKTVVETSARHRLATMSSETRPKLTTDLILETAKNHTRSIPQKVALDWIAEAEEELGTKHEPRLHWLMNETKLAYRHAT